MVSIDYQSVKTPHYSSWALVKDMWALIRPYRFRFIIAALCRFTSDLVWLYPAYALASVVNFFTAYHTGDSLAPMYHVFTLWLVATVWRFTGHSIAKFLNHRLGERMALDAELQTIRHLFALDIAWHEKENTGNKLKRVLRGGEAIDQIMRMWINNFIEIAVNFGGIIIIMTRFDRRIGMLIGVYLVTFFVIARLFTIMTARASYRVNAQEEEVSGIAFEAVNNIRTLKVLALTKTILSRIVAEMDELFRRIKRRVFWYQTRGFFLSAYGQLYRFGLAVYIGFGIIHGKYEVGFLVMYWSYFSNIWTSVGELADVAQDFAIAKYSVLRMKQIIKEPIRISAEEGKGEFPEQWKDIVFKHVSFSYGSIPVLHDVSFTIKRGERIGIVGLSGAGKSTLFKLLLKEYENFEGDVLIDGISIRQIRGSDFFKHVAVVLQDTEVFNFSLKDNITIAHAEKIHDEQLLNESLSIAHVSDFVQRLPQGLQTIIGEKGIRLSGGEKQRLGIARAVFKKPQLLLLDEATSHLDLESEEKIRDTLHQFFKQVTAIVIAHRLTTVREMDRILVLEGGELIESGTFDELYAKKGRFYDLWNKQKL